MQIQTTAITQYSRTYEAAAEGVPLAIPGSSGYIEVSVNKGDAALAASAAPGSFVTLVFF
jgi:S-adenosylmethionine hydrolase